MTQTEIKQTRKKLNLTQESLAQKLGVSFSTINRWESGQTKPKKKNITLLKKLVSTNTSDTHVVQPEDTFRPIQYLGSKKRLLPNILEILETITNKRNTTVCDIFSGSGVVTQYLSKRYNTISVDIQKYSTVLTSALINNNFSEKEIIKFINEISTESKYIEQWKTFHKIHSFELNALNNAKLEKPLQLIHFIDNVSLYDFFYSQNTSKSPNKDLEKILSNLKGQFKRESLLITLYFGGVYFSIKQAFQMDYIFHKIENGKYSEKERNFLKGILLSVASHIVNTVGKQFAQPIKLLNKEGKPKKLLISRTIRDRDYNVLELFKEWGVRYLNNQTTSTKEHQFYSKDYNEFLEQYQGKIDCFYADPPYTIDHYSRFYHVLESIICYDFPTLMKKSVNGKEVLMNGLYRDDRHQSPFSIKSKVNTAFANLFRGCKRFNAPIILSYSPSNIDKNGRSRLLEINEIINIAKEFYDFVNVIDAGKHVHRKLNAKQNNTALFENGEVFIVCTLKEINWKNI